jgi:hypothetical protein
MEIFQLPWSGRCPLADTPQPELSTNYSQGTPELDYSQSQSQSQSYVTTDGQSASLSWNKAPIWGLRPDLYYCQTVAGLLMLATLSIVYQSHSQQ